MDALLAWVVRNQGRVAFSGLQVWGIFVGIALAIVLIVTVLGKVNAWAWANGNLTVSAIVAFVYGVIYLVFLFPLAGGSIASAIVGRNERVYTNVRARELAPKVASVLATLAAGWTLFPIVILALVPAYYLWGYYMAGMTAGSLAFLVFNRPNRGQLTRLVAIPVLGVILLITAAINLVPAILDGLQIADTVWTRHSADMNLPGLSAIFLPDWISTVLWIVVALIVLAIVIRLLARLLGGVLGAAEGIIKTLITAIATIIVVAIIIGGLGYALYLIGASQTPTPSYATTPPQSKAGVLTTPAPSATKTDGTHQITLPANIEWLATGVKGCISGTASGEANAGEGNPLTNPSGDPNRVMAEWYGHPYLLPNQPEGALIGKDGPNGQPFLLGSSFQGVIISDELYVALNDASGTFRNNEGGYTLNLQVK